MAEGGGRGSLELVRVRGRAGAGPEADYDVEAIGARTEAVLTDQAAPAGSYAFTSAGPHVEAGRAWRWELQVHPTLADRGVVLDWGGGAVRLSFDGRVLRGTVPGARVELPVPVNAWTCVSLGFSAGRLVLATTPSGPDARWRRAATVDGDASPCPVGGPLELGRSFNGRVGGLRLYIDDELAARWDFSASMGLQSVPGDGPAARELLLVNAPRRAVTGAAWTGEFHDWRAAPSHYDAIHFHDDDVADSGWPACAELRIPGDAESGLYAVRLSSGADVHYAPLFVARRRPRRLAFLASTFSYLAYGNSVWASPSGAALEHRFPAEVARMRRSGLSTYSRHRDGSGVGLVSTRRPILNMRPGFLGEAVGGQVLLNDDIGILAWLGRLGEPFDVITDHELHEQGAAALAGCDVLITGAHPEYHSTESLDALKAFQDRGGRLIYLGGNGFYWRVATLPDAPHVMEVRRAEGGIRMWAEPPGEYHHQSDGRLGGLWRRLGRPPNRLVGVGYSAQGDEVESQPYRRTAASRDRRAAFLFDGVATEVFGGARAGSVAAAGYELDRADPALGTPGHALVVARSEPFEEAVAPVNEERLTHTVLDAEDPLRADLTFFETPAGGAVLSTGSVYYAQALDEDDGAGRIVANAVRRFLDPAPFQVPDAEA